MATTNEHTILRSFHQASWNEPIILEQTSPGERGIVPPATEPEIAEAVGDGLSAIPDALRRAVPPALPELSQPQVLRHYLRLSQETLGNDVDIHLGSGTCTMKYSPKVNDLLIRAPRGRRGSSLTGRRHGSGPPGGVPPVRADPLRGLRHGPVHVPAGQRLAGRLRQCSHDPGLPRGPRRGAPKRDRHDDLLPSVRRGLPRHRRLQGRDALPRPARLPRGRCRQGGRLGAHRRTDDHEPRRHGNLQPAHRRVRRGRPRGGWALSLRPGQRERHPGHHARAGRRLRPVPVQPAQDVLVAPLLHGNARGGVRRDERARALPADADGRARRDALLARPRPPAVDRQGACLPRCTGDGRARPRLGPQPRRRGIAGGRGGGRAQQQLSGEAARGRARHRRVVRGRKHRPPARADPLLPRTHEGRDGGRNARRCPAYRRLRRVDLLSEPRALARRGADDVGAVRVLFAGRPRHVRGNPAADLGRGLLGSGDRAIGAAPQHRPQVGGRHDERSRALGAHVACLPPERIRRAAPVQPAMRLEALARRASALRPPAPS